jgi:DNA polymerase III subunit delta'
MAGESQRLQTPNLPGWLVPQIAQALTMPGHALLVHGPSGLGQYEMAFALAQAWLCENPARGQAGMACGVCPSCQQIQARSHTDLVVLMPESLMIELDWPLSEKAQKEIDEKKRKPSQEIRIEAVRDAIAFAELTSGRGQGKVILVYPAHAMNHASANALLKTLEEPSGKLRFVLATESADQLLATIRSRCQALPLQAPSWEQALAELEARAPQRSPLERETLLRASGGRPMEALRSSANDLHVLWPRLPRALQQGDLQALKDLSPSDLLLALHKLCHDLWAVKLGAEPRFFAATDLPKPPPARALAAWGEQLKQLSRVIEHPWRAELLQENLVQQAKVCINSRS